jgi:CheY-like chemotaxis protein
VSGVRSPTILICEDEPSLRELMRVSLRADYEFAEAADANEAIALVDAVRPDLVLLDVMMPGGSGLTVLEHVRSNPELKNTPVIVISAFAAHRDHLAAHDAGANSFLKKPFDPDELESLVEELLASRT